MNSPLIKNYSVKVDFGKGLKAMACTTNICTLSSNQLPSSTSGSYKIGIYNNNILEGKTVDGNYIISSSVSAVVDTVASYSKISNSGTVLPNNAQLGSGTNDWACVLRTTNQV